MGRPRIHPWIVRLVTVACWLAIAFVAFRAGWQVRDWAWRETASIRFRGDIANAVAVASRTFDPPAAAPRADDPKRVDWPRVAAGYLDRYDRELRRVTHDGRRDPGQVKDNQYSFDYPPGRLLIATLWMNPVFLERGIGTGYDDAFADPMLAVNTWHELVAAAGVFAFVRLAFRRSGRGMFTSELAGMTAALFAWFNPAAIMNGHGWPQWDVWVLPYTIWAAYFGLANRWLMTGALLALGAMFKGQVLLIAPLLALWPIFRLDFSAVLRLAAGFAAAVAVLMSPWLLRASAAQVWAGGALALAAVAVSVPRRWRFTSGWWLAVAALIGWAVGPWLNASPVPPSRAHLTIAMLAFMPWERLRGWPLRSFGVVRAAIVAWLTSAAPAWALGSLSMRWPMLFDEPAHPPIQGAETTFVATLALVSLVAGLSAVWRGRQAMWLAIASCGVITLAAIHYGGSTAWWTVGFQTDRYHTMAMGRTANLPMILQQFYGLNVDTTVSMFGLLDQPDREWFLRSLMRGIAYAGVGLAAIAMAIQHRRRDANIVIAIPAAWAVIFAFMPQMHERYCLWAAVTSALLITRGFGGLLAYLALTATQFAALYAQMCEVNGGPGPYLQNNWYRAAAGLQPSSGYIVITLAIVLLVWSFRRSAPPRAVVAQPVHVPPPAEPATSSYDVPRGVAAC